MFSAQVLQLSDFGDDTNSTLPETRLRRQRSGGRGGAYAGRRTACSHRGTSKNVAFTDGAVLPVNTDDNQRGDHQQTHSQANGGGIWSDPLATQHALTTLYECGKKEYRDSEG